MARSNSPLLETARGRIGESIVVKQYSYGTVISLMPSMPKREKSRKQKEKSAWFAEAVKYAKSIIGNREKKAAYAATLPPDKLVYHAAIQEYLAEKKRVFYLPAGEEMRLMFGDGACNPSTVTNQMKPGQAEHAALENERINVSVTEKRRWDIY